MRELRVAASPGHHRHRMFLHPVEFCATLYSLIKLLTMPRVEESQEVGGNIGWTRTNTHAPPEALIHTFCSLTAANFNTSVLLRQSGQRTQGSKLHFHRRIQIYIFIQTTGCVLQTSLHRPAGRPSDSHLLMALVQPSANSMFHPQMLNEQGRNYSPDDKRFALCLDQRSAQCNPILEFGGGEGQRGG